MKIMQNTTNIDTPESFLVFFNNIYSKFSTVDQIMLGSENRSRIGAIEPEIPWKQSDVNNAKH